MPTFNPFYILTGRRNKRNPHNAKINHVRHSKKDDTRPDFQGEPTSPPVALQWVKGVTPITWKKSASIITWRA